METALAKKNDLVKRWESYRRELPEVLTVEEARREARSLIGWVHQYDTGSMIAKFCLGVITYLANPDWRTDRNYGASVITSIAEERGIHENTLREARRVAEFFGLDLVLYYDWVTEGEEPKHWGKAQKIIRAHDDPDVHGPEKLANIIAGKIERAGENLSRLREMAYKGEMDPEVVEGIEQSFLDDLRAFEEERDRIFEPPTEDKKRRTPRSEKYLDFVRRQKCAATGEDPPNEPHHVEQLGTGTKGSDFTAIPLCYKVHSFLEDHGHRAAERRFQFSIIQAMIDCLHQYHHGYRPTLPGDISNPRKGY